MSGSLIFTKPEPDSSHREISAEFAQVTEEFIEDLVYGMAKEGMPLPSIAKYFGVQQRRLDPYQRIYDMGKAMLEHAVLRRQIDMALTAPAWQTPFHAGVVLFGQGRTDETTTVDSRDVKFNISVVQSNEDKT